MLERTTDAPIDHCESFIPNAYRNQISLALHLTPAEKKTKLSTLMTSIYPINICSRKITYHFSWMNIPRNVLRRKSNKITLIILAVTFKCTTLW